MKNKQHEYILKAFIESRIPNIIREKAPELIAVDSVLGGYCTQLIKENYIMLTSNNIISKTEQVKFSALINQASGVDKLELVVYYRLIVLVGAILIQYRQ